MSFRTIVELTDRICKEPTDERRLRLFEELRKLLNEEREMLRANIETLLPHTGTHDQRDNRSNREGPMPDPHSLRKRAEELRIKAINLVREADALTLRAENVEKAATQVQGNVNKPGVQSA